MYLPSLAVLLHWCQLSISFYNLYLQNAWPFGNLMSAPDAGLAPTKLHISSSYQLQMPADRAEISITTFAEGSDQDRVADDIKAYQDEMMELLRPLTQPPSPASSVVNATQTLLSPDLEPAIVSLGVNTFKAASHRRRQTIFGEKPIYEASVDIDAEFADMDAMGHVIGKLLRKPTAKLNSLKWKLKDASRQEALAKCQQAAAKILKSKAMDFAGPLGLDVVRAVSISERTQGRKDEMMLMSAADELPSHDELDFRMSSVPDRQGAMQFEPRRLTFEVELEGEFQAW